MTSADLKTVAAACYAATECRLCRGIGPAFVYSAGCSLRLSAWFNEQPSPAPWPCMRLGSQRSGTTSVFRASSTARRLVLLIAARCFAETRTYPPPSPVFFSSETSSRGGLKGATETKYTLFNQTELTFCNSLHCTSATKDVYSTEDR